MTRVSAACTHGSDRATNLRNSVLSQSRDAHPRWCRSPDGHAPLGTNSATHPRASVRTRHTPHWPSMRKLLLIVFLICLSLGIGVGARLGVRAWLDWIDEPLRQRSNLQLGTVARPPLVGAQAGQAPATQTAAPPSVTAAA